MLLVTVTDQGVNATLKDNNSTKHRSLLGINVTIKSMHDVNLVHLPAADTDFSFKTVMPGRRLMST